MTTRDGKKYKLKEMMNLDNVQIIPVPDTAGKKLGLIVVCVREYSFCSELQSVSSRNNTNRNYV